MNYSAFSTYSCIRYYDFFSWQNYWGGQNDMFAPPIFSLGGGGGGDCPPCPPGSTPLYWATIPCESMIKTQHFLIVRCLQNRAWICANVIWLSRVILSNYFDTTFDEYCFTDDVTGAGIVTEGKIPYANFYMVSEWETQLKKQMTQGFDMVSLGVFVCCLFIHGKMIHKMVLTRSIRDSETSIDFVQGPPGSRRERVKIIGKISSTAPYHIHRYLPSNLKTMNHWKVLHFNWLTL